MSTPKGNAESHASKPSQRTILSKFRDDLAKLLNVEQMFVLIDGALPFEACLYYQVLPLFLEGNRLHLGMVSPDDDSAAEYVRRIIAYHNYSLVSHCISSEALQTSLTAYLQYSRTKNSSLPDDPKRKPKRQQVVEPTHRSIQDTLVVESPEELLEAEGFVSADAMTSLPTFAETSPPKVAIQAPTGDPLAVLRGVKTALQEETGEVTAVASVATPQDSTDARSKLSDSQPLDSQPLDSQPFAKALARTVLEPPDTEEEPRTMLEVPEPDKTDGSGGHPGAEGAAAHIDQPAVAPSKTEAASQVDLLNRLKQRPPATPHPSMRMDAETLIDIPFERPELTDSELPGTAQNAQASQAPARAEQAVPLIHPIPKLAVPGDITPTSKISHLGNLPPKKILQNLLSRTANGGIGRLFFEAKRDHGRVLWSQDGKLKSVLEELSLESYQGILRELKQLAGLPTEPVSSPKQVERERLYRKNRILMIFRFNPGEYGENGTLQILRGSAMQFYQQQRLTKLERDALGIAKQLQGKLNELRDRARAESKLRGTKLEALPALSELLQNIEQQLDSLQERGEDEEIPE